MNQQYLTVNTANKAVGRDPFVKLLDWQFQKLAEMDRHFYKQVKNIHFMFDFLSSAFTTQNIAYPQNVSNLFQFCKG